MRRLINFIRYPSVVYLIYYTQSFVCSVYKLMRYGNITALLTTKAVNTLIKMTSNSSMPFARTRKPATPRRSSFLPGILVLCSRASSVLRLRKYNRYFLPHLSRRSLLRVLVEAPAMCDGRRKAEINRAEA